MSYDHKDITRVSQSMLKTAMQDGWRMFQARYLTRTVQKETTYAMQLGSLLHAMVLEPDSKDLFVRVPEECSDKRSKAYKDWAIDIDCTLPHIKHDDWNDVATASRMILEHPTASRIIAACQKEVPIHWEHAGVACRGKIDLLNRSEGYVADLKSTSSIMPTDFSRDVANLGYHMQIGAYLNAAEVGRFAWIAVEIRPPFRVRVYEADDAMVQYGLEVFDAYVKEYGARKAMDDWADADEDIASTISFPSYFFKQRQYA